MGARLSHFCKHDAITLLHHSIAIPRVLHLLRTTPCFQSPLLKSFDLKLRSCLSAILNVDLVDGLTWTQAVELITNQSMSFENNPTHANSIVSAVKKRNVEQQNYNADRIRKELEPSSQRLVDCASEPGASAWLTALPNEEHGFCLSKGSFRDALSLRYGWPILELE